MYICILFRTLVKSVSWNDPKKNTTIDSLAWKNASLASRERIILSRRRRTNGPNKVWMDMQYLKAPTSVIRNHSQLLHWHLDIWIIRMLGSGSWITYWMKRYLAQNCGYPRNGSKLWRIRYASAEMTSIILNADFRWDSKVQFFPQMGHFPTWS